MTPEFDDLGDYELVLRECSKHGIDPSSSIEAEDYFRNLLAQYTGDTDRNHFASWLDDWLADDFVALAGRPKWIQGANCPFSNGLPMVFIGQIDISVKDVDRPKRFFHDDTSFYVFVDKQAKPTVIVQ